MERWNLSLLLLSAAAVGALVAPSLRARAPAPPTPTIPEVVIPTIPEASAADDLTITATLDRTAALLDGDGLRYLVVTVTAPDTDAERVPVDITMVVDTSGSMGQQGKIEAARTAADELVDALRPGDRFGLVSFDDRARVLVEGERFDGDAARLHRVIDGLRDDGGTNLWDGLSRGRDELASEHPARKLLVVSDGNANVGETDPAAFARLTRGYATEGVSVSAIGLGRDFNEDLLEGMADAGGGSYRFVGNPEELPAVIAAELERTTQTLARQARVRITPASGVRIREVYGWTAETTAGETEVHVGDIAAGQARKIVLAVEVPTGAQGDTAVATAQVSWAPVDGGANRSASARSTVFVTEDRGVVASSIDEAATVAATRARAGALTRASAEAWRRGDSVRARAMMRSASDTIAETRGVVDAPELDDDVAKMDQLLQLGYAEGSAYAAKAASEAGRDLSR